MFGRDLKILIKTFADLTGLTKLGTMIRGHSIAVRGLVGTYKLVASAGKAAFSLVSAELRMLRNGALAAGASLAVVVRQGIMFNVNLARAWTMSNQSIGGLLKWRAALLDMSAALGVAKDELASGLYQALSASVSEDRVLPFLKTAAKVAVADGSTIETAVDGITTILNAFNLKAEKTDYVVDQMFTTVRNGKTTFGQLASNIASAAPAAAAANVKFEELLASVATLTKQGTPTAVALTQVNAAIFSMNEKLGENWRTKWSLVEGLSEMRKRAKAAGGTLQEFMGRKEAVMAVLGMTGNNAAMAARDIEATAKATGALDEAFSKVQQFRGWSTVWQSMHAYAVQIGSEIERRWAPRIAYIADKINEIRKGEGFTGLVDTLATKLDEALTNIIVQVKTAADLIAELKGADFSFARVATVAKTIITELVGFAVSLLFAQLKAGTDILIGLAKVISAAVREDLINTPVIGKMIKAGLVDNDKASQAARGRVISETGYDWYDPSDTSGRTRFTEQGRKRLQADELYRKYLDEEKEKQITGAVPNATADLQQAFDQTKDNLKTIAADLSKDFDESMARIKQSVSNASGGGFDWDARAAENKKQVMAFGAPAPVAQEPVASEEAKRSAARLAADLQKQMAEAGAAARAVQYEEARQYREESLRRSRIEAGVRNIGASGGEVDSLPIPAFEPGGKRLDQLRSVAERESQDVRQVYKSIETLMEQNQSVMTHLVALMEKHQADSRNMGERVRRLPI